MKKLSTPKNNRDSEPFGRNAKRFTFLIILLILLVSPLATVAQAQTNNSQQKSGLSITFPFNLKVFAQGRKATPTPRAVRQNARQAQQPNIFQRIWSVITAPFNALVNLVTPQAPKKSPSPAPKAVAPSPQPSPTAEVTTDTTTGTTSVGTSVATGGLTVTSLGAGTKYVDLIGKTIIDSSGNIYPSNDALAQSTKPSLGSSTNKFYGLILNNLEVSSGGFLTTKDKVTLGDESGDTIKFVGRIGTDIVPSGNDEITLGKSGNAFKQSFITTVSSSTVNTDTINVTTVKLEDGTASAPGLRFTNDTNSGLYRFEADGIALITAGASSNLLSLNSSGNVGIGTTSPIRTLHVIGSGQFTTSILNADGSVSAPAYSFSADTDNGLFRPSTNALGFATNGVSRLTVTETGNVGIGTTSPGALFVVTTGNVGIGTSSAGANIQVNGNGIFGFSTTTSLTGPTNGLAISGNLGIGTSTANNPLSVAGAGVFGINYAGLTAPSQGLIVEGNVGIGFTTPQANLHILNTGSGLSVRVDDSANDLSPFVIAADGNVGIANSAPSFTLDVVGTGRLSSSLTVEGTTTLNGAFTLGDNGDTGSINTSDWDISTTGALTGIGAITADGLLTLSLANQAISLTGTNPALTSSGTNPLTLFPGSGNVGIGTSDVGGTLVVLGTAGAGTGNVGIGFTTPTANLHILNTGSGNSFRVDDAANDLSPFIINLDGNVGIANSAPSYALDVVGSSRFSTNITQAGGQFLAADGTVSLPSYSFSADTDNGLFRPSTNALGFATNGVSRLTVTETGNVGIGTTSPGALFVVTTGNIGVGTSAAGARLQVNGNGIFGFSTTTSLTGPTNGLAISGNVGVGTTTANSLLSVTGGVVIGSGTGFNAAAPANGLLVQGNVGIGFSSPSSQLFVVDPAFTGVPGAAAIAIFGSTDGTTGGVAIRARGTITGALADFGEYIQVEGEVSSYGQGDVLAASQVASETATKSQTTYQDDLLGIVTTTASFIAGGESAGIEFDATGRATNRVVIALAGRLPVKVSTENGPIAIGDYLTSSSLSGVAMKAKKAGPVLGQALSSFNGEGVGTVSVFVRLGYFNGVSLVDDAVLGVSSADPSNSTVLILAKLLSERLTLMKNARLSNITTDRITAGLEVITPQLTADTVLLRTLKPVKDGNLVLALGKDQLFEVVDDQKERVVSIDSLGNAYFKGRVVAASVKADSIEGLKILADQVFANKIASLLDFTKTLQATASSALAQTPTLDTNVVRFDGNGGLTVGTPSEFRAKSIFADIVEFIAAVIFRGDVSFLGRATFNQDTAGLAVVKSGSESVDVAFARPYSQIPFVNVTVTTYSGNDGAGNSILTGDIRYVVQNLSGGGFRIKLNRAAPADITLSWTAIAVSSHTVSTGSSGTTQPAATTAEASPTPQPQPSASPSPEATPSPTPTPSPSPTPEATSSATISL